MLVEVAAVLVEVTNSSRNFFPTVTPLGTYRQSDPTACAFWAWAGRSGNAQSAPSSSAATGSRRERRARPPSGSGRARSRGGVGPDDGERDGVEAAGRCAPAPRRTHFMALGAQLYRPRLGPSYSASSTPPLHAGTLPPNRHAERRPNAVAARPGSPGGATAALASRIHLFVLNVTVDSFYLAVVSI